MYGTPAGVAALTKQWTDDGQFTDECILDCLNDQTTNPTLTEVNTWLTQISDTMDVALAGAGFVVPVVTPVRAINMITVIVEQYVADLVKYVNNTGRFATERAQQFGIEPMIQLSKDINKWANENSTGLENAGAPKISASSGQILTKSNFPLFSRNAFGNRFTDGRKE